MRRTVLALPPKSPKYREALILFYFHGMDTPAAARSLGLPEGTVKARLLRGRELLRGKLPTNSNRPASEGGMMSHDEIDRILSREEGILPSSGFAVSVMGALRREAAAPPPIPFPWKRALPGLAAAGLMLVLVVVVLVVAVTHLGGQGVRPQLSAKWTLALMIVNGTILSAAGWMLLALALTFVSVALSLRLGTSLGPDRLLRARFRRELCQRQEMQVHER